MRRSRINDVRPALHIIGGVVKSNALMVEYAVILQKQHISIQGSSGTGSRKRLNFLLMLCLNTRKKVFSQF
jgi:hypothetical protein